MMVKRILVGFDGSPPSEKAVIYASKLAKELHAKLTLFYVVPVLYPPLDTLPVIQETKAKLSLTEADERVVAGNPAAEIASAAEATDIDLVVVGSSGKGAVARLMLGSTASRLVRTCPKPLVVVP
jgi:nucleotide-binding universal stress UspA family protein